MAVLAPWKGLLRKKNSEFIAQAIQVFAENEL
jgi:hypothetical protein